MDEQLPGQMNIQNYPEVISQMESDIITQKDEGKISSEMKLWLSELAMDKLSEEEIVKGFISRYHISDS